MSLLATPFSRFFRPPPPPPPSGGRPTRFMHESAQHRLTPFAQYILTPLALAQYSVTPLSRFRLKKCSLQRTSSQIESYDQPPRLHLNCKRLAYSQKRVQNSQQWCSWFTQKIFISLVKSVLEVCNVAMAGWYGFCCLPHVVGGRHC